MRVTMFARTTRMIAICTTSAALLAALGSRSACIPIVNGFSVQQQHHQRNEFAAVTIGRPNSAATLQVRSSLLTTEEWDVKATTSRRNFFLSSAAALAAASAAGNLPGMSTKTATQLSTVPDVIQWIDEFCDRRFLHAVVASDYRFLYRGVNVHSSTILTEEPDLLSLETYGSPEALQFFQDLDVMLSGEPVRPSNGHLATTSIRDAEFWGATAASIWPMMVMAADPVTATSTSTDDAAHYAWFQDGGLFYPRTASRSLDRNSVIVDGRDCGKDSLEDALLGDSCEILVATNAFLAVPVSMEKELREGLKKSFLV